MNLFNLQCSGIRRSNDVIVRAAALIAGYPSSRSFGAHSVAQRRGYAAVSWHPLNRLASPLTTITSPFPSLLASNEAISGDNSVRSGDVRYLERLTEDVHSLCRQSAIAFHKGIPQSAEEVSEGVVEDIPPIEAVSSRSATVKMDSCFLASAQVSCLAAPSVLKLRPSSMRDSAVFSPREPHIDYEPAAYLMPSLAPVEMTIRSPVYQDSVSSHYHPYSDFRTKRPPVSRPSCKFN